MNILRNPKPYLAIAVAFLLVITLRSAWVCDDAYITFRCVDNFVAGYGPTWNTAERVQAFTHPLWMFVMSAAHAVTGDVYFTSIILSLLLTAAVAVLIVWRVAVSTPSAALAVGALTISKAFIDYSTSGLENALTHLLLVVFTLFAALPKMNPRRFTWMALVGGLAILNRMDTGLIVMPALLWQVWRGPRAARLARLGIGLAPVFAWELFSILYYGYPFPNTAYAKLNTGILRVDLVTQGFAYLRNSLVVDPATLPLIAAGVALAFADRTRRLVPVAIGALLYVGYVVWIGGDFMSGRLLTAPLLCAAVFIARSERLDTIKAWAPAAAAVVALGVLAPNSPWRAGRDYGTVRDGLVDTKGVADERGYYFQFFGLLRADGKTGVDDYREAVKGRADRNKGPHVAISGNIGVFGYFAGPDVYVIDGFALADPFLSRLPVRSPNWRIGHFTRAAPPGYYQSLEAGRNVLQDPKLKSLYDKIRTATRGPVLDRGRLGVLWKLNTGGYRHLVADRFQSFRAHQQAYDAAAADRDAEAVAHFERAVALDPTRADAWYGLFRLSAEQGRLDDANDAISAAMRLAPGQYEGDLMGLALKYRDRGDYETATDLAQRAFDSSVRVGRKYERMGFVAEAREQYERALRINPDAEDVRARLDALK